MQTFETNIREAYENLGLPDEVVMDTNPYIEAERRQDALIKRIDGQPAPVFAARVRGVSDGENRYTLTTEFGNVYVDRENLKTGEYDVLKLFFPKDGDRCVTFETVKEWLANCA